MIEHIDRRLPHVAGALGGREEIRGRCIDRPVAVPEPERVQDVARIDVILDGDFVGTSLAFSPPTSAALRYWNMARQRYCRRLARNGKPCASLPTQSPSQPRTPARKAGVLDLRKRIWERDRLSGGGRRIR